MCCYEAQSSTEKKVSVQLVHRTATSYEFKSVFYSIHPAPEHLINYAEVNPRFSRDATTGHGNSTTSHHFGMLAMLGLHHAETYCFHSTFDKKVAILFRTNTYFLVKKT